MNLENFRLALFRLSYVSERMVLMPEYKGSVLRGGFGAALKHVSCTRENTTCEVCILKDNCAYSRIFETPIPDNSKYFEGRGYAPHPFIIEPPLETKREYYDGESMVFQLILVGDAINYLPYFILAFHILGQWGLGEKNETKRGKAFMEKVESVSYDGGSHVIYDGESQRFCAEHDIISVADICNSTKCQGTDKIALDFVTPTRIKTDNKLRESIDFEMLVRALTRRILALSYFHCGQEPDIDYRDLIEKAKQKIQKVDEKSRWSDWSRYSRRQNTKLMMGGFKGKVVFQGDLQDFMPLILLGEYIHVGKGTAFGLGKYFIYYS